MTNLRFGMWKRMAVAVITGVLAVTLQAADQWWDTSNASGLTPGSNFWDTSTLTWSMSASPGTAAPVAWTNGNNAWFNAGNTGISTVTVNGVTANIVILQTSTPGGYVFLPGTGPLTINGGLTNQGINATALFFTDIALGNTQTWFIGYNTTVTGKVTGAGMTLTKKGAGILTVSNSLNSLGGLVIDSGDVKTYNNALGGGHLTLGGSNQLSEARPILNATANGTNFFTISNLTVAGGGRIDFGTGGYAGNTNVLNGQMLSRVGRGTLLINEANSGTLGVRNRVFLAGGLTHVNGAVEPWLMGSAADATSTLYLLTNDVVKGLSPITWDSQAGAWTSTKKILVGSSTTLNQDTNAYALYITANNVTNNARLTLGNGQYAPLLCRVNSTSQGLLGGGTLAFGTAELIVCPALPMLIANTLEGSGGLTMLGLGTLVISNMTYTGDTWINGGTLNVAPSGTTTYANSIGGFGSLTKSGPGTLILKDNNTMLGNGVITVSDATLALANATLSGGAVNVGTTAGDLNRLMTVGNSTVNCGAVTVGGASATNNQMTVASSTLNSSGAITVGNGANALNNQMTITNSTLNSFGVSIGLAGLSNRVTVGQGSVWNVNNNPLNIGVQGGSTLLLEGGTVTNHSVNSYIGNGASAYGNSLIIRNGGKLFKGTGSPDLYVGGLATGSSNNLLQVGGSGFASYASFNKLYVGGNGAMPNNGNQLVVTNGTLETSGSVAIGRAGTNNNASILAGGTWMVSGQPLAIGDQIGGSSNWVLVSGGVVNTSNQDLQIGSAANANNNSLIISNGGTVVCRSLVAGNNAAAAGNVCRVMPGGILQAASFGGGLLNVGTNAGNMITNNGGVYQFNSNLGTAFVTNGAPGGCIFLNNGVIAMLGWNTADVKRNWSGTDLARITYTGANAFRLNNATNNSGTAGAQSYWFDTGRGATNYAGLEMFNGGTAYTNGSVTIGTNGWLTFSNTTAVMWGAVTNFGIMRLMRSTVTFKSGLALAEGCRIVCDTNSSVTVAGTLALPVNATLTVDGLDKKNSMTLFTATTVTGSATSWSVEPVWFKVKVSGNTVSIVPRQVGSIISVQ